MISDRDNVVSFELDEYETDGADFLGHNKS